MDPDYLQEIVKGLMRVHVRSAAGLQPQGGKQECNAFVTIAVGPSAGQRPMLGASKGQISHKEPQDPLESTLSPSQDPAMGSMLWGYVIRSAAQTSVPDRDYAGEMHKRETTMPCPKAHRKSCPSVVNVAGPEHMQSNLTYVQMCMDLEE